MDEMGPRSLLLVATLCACLQVAVAQWTGQLSAYQIASFQNPDTDPNTKLNHVTFNGTSDVYVGAVNSIYRLDGDFVEQSNASTAPDCADPDDCANENKILFVEPLRDKLMTCGSDNEGRCQQRNRDDLTIKNVDPGQRSVVRVSPGRGKTNIGLLASGPASRQWLYVASTYTSSSTDVPPVARRDLGLVIPDQRLFFSSEDNQVTFTRPYAVSPFDIKYVYGFSFNGFTYFVTAQQESLSSGTFVSKILRVCQRSNTFESYTEVVLRCNQESQSYNLAQAAYLGRAGSDLAASLSIQESSPMLFAVFADNIGASNTPSNSSALCAFRMDEIEDAFEMAILNCVTTGNDEYKVGYLDGSKCKDVRSFTNAQLQAAVCNVPQNLYRNIYNPTGVSVTPMFWVQDARMSSIITSMEMNHTIAFIGTSQGSLMKVHIENGTYGRHYETIKLGDVAILTDVSLDESKQELRVLTEQQLLKMRVENCSQYTSCESCIGKNVGQDGDPYCGWCTLQNKCTVYSECPMADVSTRWLPYNAIQCVVISNIEPANLPITYPPQTITLTVYQLPDLETDESYSCQFNDLPLSQGETTGNIITCRTPNTVPQIPQSEDRVTLVLSVFSSESNVNFISSTFNFYDCTRHTSCSECVSSDWDCDWCVYDNRCTHMSSECTTGDYIISGNNNPDASSMQGPSFCPQLQPQTQEVLVPVTIPREIQVPASNLPNATQLTKDYQCSLLVEGARQTVSATVIQQGIIQCNSQMYSYAANEQELDVQLIVTWNGDRQLDDSNGFKVTLYKCDVDRLDCSRCLSNITRPELECRWCGDQCAFKDDVMCRTGARDPSDPCPAPDLEKVEPATGPIEGNTVIEITGTNIGRSFEDVRSVMIGQQSCNLTGFDDQYVTGRSVRCRTVTMDVTTPQPIQVSVAPVAPPDDTNLISTGDVSFTYTDPTITSIDPKGGPADGGTVLTIQGTYLNTGREIQATIADDAVCHFNRLSNEEVVCRTTNSSVGSAGQVTLSFDGAPRRSAAEFTYNPNPNVMDINPRKSIISGGRTVHVSGRYFQQIQAPQIITTLETESGNRTFQKLCEVVSDTNLTCETPDISSALRDGVTGRRKRETAPSPIIGFIMADVASLRRWSETQAPPGFEFEYVPNPVFDPFQGEGNILDLEGTKLTIRGSNLNTAQTAAEVQVFIGTEPCSVEDFDSSLLICEAPLIEPQPLDYQGNQTSTGLPAVYVLHSRQSFFIGYIRYITSLEIGLYIGIAAAVALVPVLLLALFLWRKLRGSQKQIGEILIQMEEVEKGMAEDLRIAFAELQTNVTDLTHDLAGTGMPFVSHRQYATNMLFIGLDVQPETCDPQKPEETTERAMAQFNKLLAKKSFLLAFIQALDDNKRIPMKDKSTIASLLTIIMMLEDKLGYLTDVMITLMSRQVQEAVDNNRPKQLFRRTESIVEKLLSNWIALCLYDQLKDRTAFPLFLLYSGIKVQTEKGPVDAVTRQAHFSLSEERLLKGSVEFAEMTLNVVVDSEDGEKKEVKVLNVDAVPQIKEKILDSMYRNKPYSDRQRAEDVNLEWRQGKSGRLVLQEVCLPQIANPDSKDKQKWQKLNTLAELSVPDNSMMALVPKQSVRTSINEATAGFLSGISTADSSLYQHEIDMADGAILWHLEKPHEEIEESEKQKKKRQREMALGKGKKTQNITFPRLLTMKGIVQEYVDKMFHTILTVEGTPLAIKYLFDFFDSQASRHGIEDPDIAHTWKSNTLPLRFWVSAINHPNYIFDIRPTPSVESSLGVVGQAFYDSCNKSDHQLGWESSFNKLLYNREVNLYRGLVESFYDGIRDMKRITSNELEKELDKTCKNFTGLFSKLSTLLQLFQLTNSSKELLMNAMEEDEVCQRDNLAYELEQVGTLLEEEGES